MSNNVLAPPLADCRAAATPPVPPPHTTTAQWSSLVEADAMGSSGSPKIARRGVGKIQFRRRAAPAAQRALYPRRMSFTLTTPLYYVNDRAHLGSAYTTLACDAIARTSGSRVNRLSSSPGVMNTAKRSSARLKPKA